MAKKLRGRDASGIELPKYEEWEERVKHHTIKIDPMSDVLLGFADTFPCYVFVERFFKKYENTDDQQYLTIFGEVGHGLTFINRDNSPFYHDPRSEDGKRWFGIERRNFRTIISYINETCPSMVMCDGREGWIIPLFESEHIETWEDANSYLHNLMFWESLIKSDESGPLMERIVWLTQRILEHKKRSQDAAYMVHSIGSSRVTPFDDDPLLLVEATIRHMEKEKRMLEEKYQDMIEKVAISHHKLDDRQHLFEQLIDRMGQREEMQQKMEMRTQMFMQRMDELQHIFVHENAAIMESIMTGDKELTTKIQELLDNLHKDEQ